MSQAPGGDWQASDGRWYPAWQHPAYRHLPPPPHAWPVERSGNGYSTAGILCGVLALIVPIVFGPISLILAAVGRSRSENRAVIAFVASGLGFFLGILLNLVVWLVSLS